MKYPFKNRSRIYIPFAFVTALLIMACQQKTPSLANGIWRGVLQTDSTIDIPFNFEIYDSAGTTQIAFLNGEERLNINEVSRIGDSIIIKTPLYDTEIRALSTGKGLSGIWIKHLPGGDQQMPFSAKWGRSWRYSESLQPTNQVLAGRWSVQIVRPASADTTFSVGEFTQNKNLISGTFLTNFGDYRYLSGEMDRDNLFLSSYNGSSATLFTGHFLDDNTIVNGKIYSGPTYVADWTAKRDSSAILPDSYSLTKLKEGESQLTFKFPDTEGQLVSINDDRFKNKVVIIQFLGSWCPNCMDETAFLSPFYEKYKNKGVEIIGLAYERYAEPERAKKAVSNLMNRFQVSYPVLLTGFTNKPADVLKSIPELANFSAFPTTIIIDKEGRVRSIHTGFDGPATGKAYIDYITKFEQKINNLLSE
jgi:thiol-disulfide isomerase/thioredoxin